MQLTKNDMARVIVQALYNIAELPAVDNIHVVRASRGKKAGLVKRYEKAHRILTQRA